jgi:phosphotransferase system enzyme I (PtsP)
MLLDLDVAEIQAFLREELNHAGGGETLRPKLAHFAETHGIPI